MSISTVKAVINGQTYPVALDSDGYYTLDSTAPGISSIHQPGGYYDVQVTLTDEAGNATILDAADSTFGEQLRLWAKEKTKPTVSLTYPSNDSRINTCTPTITAQLRDNDSGIDPATLDLRINSGAKIGSAAPGMTMTQVEGGYDLSYKVPEALPEGSTTITLSVSDRDGNAADPAAVTCMIAVTAPTISLSSPADGLVTNQAAVLIEGVTSDDQLTSVTLTVTVNGVSQGEINIDSSTGAFSLRASTKDMREGENTIVAHVVDATGLEAEITRTVKLDTKPPRVTEIIGVTDKIDTGAPFRIRIKAVDD